MEFKLEQWQELVLRSLSNSPLKEKFYWTGGTALAYLYLRHRLSYDLDFFSGEAFSYEEVLPLVNVIKTRGGAKKVEEKRIADRWEFFIHNQAKFRLEFVFYKFPSLRPKKIWHGIKVDSLTDIAASKTMALLDRHEPKDAFDLYHIIRKGKFSPKNLLALVKQKFGVDFALSSLWGEALTGAKQLNAIKPLMLQSGSAKDKIIKEITEYFQNESVKFLRSRIGNYS